MSDKGSRTAWEVPPFEVPSDGVLYHYTSLDGIFGIAKERALWATDATYLTDASEFRFGLELLKEAVRDRVTASPPDTGGQLLREFGRFLESGSITSRHVFVASFSQNRDQLSQWRGYTPEGGGVSVGFQTEKLLKVAATQDFHLAHCVYTEPEQRAIVRKVIDETLRAGSVATKNGSDCWLSFQENVSRTLSHLLQIKHPAFHEEKEVRLISNNAYLEKEVDYRVTRSTVLPYVRFLLPTYEVDPEAEAGTSDELRLTGDVPDETWLDIHSVFMGPSLGGQRTLHSLHKGLRRAKVFMEYNVHKSAIPFTPRVG